MIVLRLTTGTVSRQVRTALAEAVIGSDPSADIHLEHAGLAARALRLEHLDTEIEVQEIGTDRKLRIRVGDEAWTLVDNPGGAWIDTEAVRTDAAYLIARRTPARPVYLLTHEASTVVLDDGAFEAAWPVRTAVEIGAD